MSIKVKINHIIAVYLISLPMVLLYIFYSLAISNEIVNKGGFFYFIIFLSSIGTGYGLIQMKYLRRRSDFFNFFTFFWCIAFYFNSYKLLRLQIEWDSTLALYILLLPIIASTTTLLFKEKYSYRSINYIKIIQFITVACLAISFLILFSEMLATGIFPLLTNNINISRLKFSLPIFHVISEALLTLSYVLASYNLVINKKYIKTNILILLFAFVYFILTYSRSGIIGLSLFFLLLYALQKRKKIICLSWKNIIIFLLIIFIFGILGNIRQSNNFSINNYSESRINNTIINWFYSYYFVNMDNLGLSIEHDAPNMKGEHVFLFFYSLKSRLLGTDNPGKVDNWSSYTYIGKLNLGTGFRDFTLDYGLLGGFISLAIFLSIYALLIRMFKTNLLLPYKALILSYIALFPMVNRLSGLIPIFLIFSLLFLDLLFSKKYIIKTSLEQV